MWSAAGSSPATLARRRSSRTAGGPAAGLGRFHRAAVADPLISCIVPVYNGERFLAEALDSMLGQTYRPLEDHRRG